VVADISDPASLDSMTAKTAAVIALAGPYAKLGTPIVEACIRNGAHYVDLTGATISLHHGLDPGTDAALARRLTHGTPWLAADKVTGPSC